MNRNVKNKGKTVQRYAIKKKKDKLKYLKFRIDIGNVQGTNNSPKNRKQLKVTYGSANRPNTSRKMVD